MNKNRNLTPTQFELTLKYLSHQLWNQGACGGVLRGRRRHKLLHNRGGALNQQKINNIYELKMT
jgi:hypothetical protein